MPEAPSAELIRASFPARRLSVFPRANQLVNLIITAAEHRSGETDGILTPLNCAKSVCRVENMKAVPRSFASETCRSSEALLGFGDFGYTAFRQRKNACTIVRPHGGMQKCKCLSSARVGWLTLLLAKLDLGEKPFLPSFARDTFLAARSPIGFHFLVEDEFHSFSALAL
jgi:hypothetical protein